MKGVDPNCKECNGFGWHPNALRVGYEMPLKKAYAPCQTCNDEYREILSTNINALKEGEKI